jgi:hypothetical protein
MYKSEATPAPEKTRPLHTPRRIRLETNHAREPGVIFLSGRRLAVETVLERWRIDDEWWRERSVSRLYYRLQLEDGRTVDVYQAQRTGAWFRQTY